MLCFDSDMHCCLLVGVPAGPLTPERLSDAFVELCFVLVSFFLLVSFLTCLILRVSWMSYLQPG